MPERADPNHPLWQKRALIFPTAPLAYLVKRYRYCQPYIQDKIVLDVPCGSGMGGPFLKSAKRLMGLDRDKGAVNFTLEKYHSFYECAVTANMTELPFTPMCIDVVICLEGIEHISREEGITFLDEASRVLSEGGMLLLSCPVSEGAYHSGNEYHLYEWSLVDLIDQIERHFMILDRRLDSGPAGKVLLLAAQRRSCSTENSAYSDQRYSTSLIRTTRWILGQYIDSRARFASNEQPELISSCFAVLAQESLGTLQQLGEQRLRNISNQILESQDCISGLFEPMEVRESDLLWPWICDLRYVRYQITYFAISALAALGHHPKYPLRFAEPFLDSSFSLGWIDAGPWHDPWNQSNRIMFILRFLLHFAVNDGQSKAYAVIDAVLVDLLRRQNPETGLWHGNSNVDIPTAVYASYHFFPFMFCRGILPPYSDRIIDSTLSIQHADGLFGPHIGGGACEDLDAIDILVKFSLVTDYRRSDVKRALFRAYNRLLQIQNRDGGFPNYLLQPLPNDGKSMRRRVGETLGLDKLLRRPYRRTEMTYYSGWTRVKAARGASDMWGSWFRTLALNLIVSRYAELGSLTDTAAFHKYPALGWHNVDCVQRAKSISDL